jgi:predicted nucleic acid-binding protein
MPGFLLDTSCMIAAVCGWHEHHDPAAEEIEQRLGRGDTMLVAAPALVETYAVLTRLPPPHRLSAADSLALIDANFLSGTEIIALDGTSYRTLLRRAPAEGIVGGQAYDAVIASCGVAAGAKALLTFNERHFLPFAGWGLDIVVPGVAGNEAG